MPIIREIAEKLVRTNGERLVIAWPGEGFWSFRPVGGGSVDDETLEFARRCVDAAIREFGEHLAKHYAEKAIRLRTPPVDRANLLLAEAYEGVAYSIRKELEQ